MEKVNDECEVHKGERKQLVCVDPCKAVLCPSCLANHRKHDIRTLAEVGKEIIKKLESEKEEINNERTVVTSQRETINTLKDDIGKYLRKQQEDEKATELAVTEPLRDIISEFQDKVQTYMHKLDSKEETCKISEERAKNRVDSLCAKIRALSTAVTKDDYAQIYQKWIEHSSDTSTPVPEDVSKKEAEEFETLRNYASDLKNLNIPEKMKIISHTVANAWQAKGLDPMSQLGEHLEQQRNEVVAYRENVVNAQTLIKNISKNFDDMKSEIDRNLKAANATMLLMKKGKGKDKTAAEKLRKIADVNEELLKSAREKLISETNVSNSNFRSLVEKEKDLNREHTMYVKLISDWEKELQQRAKEAAEIKKLLAKANESTQECTKCVNRFNLHYMLKLQEFEKLDSRLQYIRNCLAQNKTTDTEEKPQKVYKLRVSVISASNSHLTSLLLINRFLFGKTEECKEEYTGVKGYSLSVKLEEKEDVEFNIWYLGCVDDAKSADISYLHNVEAVLVVYNNDDNDQECLEEIKRCVDSLQGRLLEGCIVGITGISKKAAKEGETGSSDSAIGVGAVSSFAMSKGLPLKYRIMMNRLAPSFGLEWAE